MAGALILAWDGIPAAAKVTPLMASAVSSRRIVCFMTVPKPGCQNLTAGPLPACDAQVVAPDWGRPLRELGRNGGLLSQSCDKSRAGGAIASARLVAAAITSRRRDRRFAALLALTPDGGSNTRGRAVSGNATDIRPPDAPLAGAPKPSMAASWLMRAARRG